MKAIILAGGSGTRLYPITQASSKQLMPLYDKPMIYYPLSTLLLAGIKDILVITTPEESDNFQKLLQDGSQWGISISYEVQEKPRGIAEAFLIAKDFIGDEDVCLILGDNLFYGQGFSGLLQKAKDIVQQQRKSVVFGYEVSDPERYGVIEFDQAGNALSIEEKPHAPKSNFAVVGLYMYTNDVLQVAQQVTPSDRGELEITSINQHYLEQDTLQVETMNRGYAWLDTGTHESLLEASNFIAIIEKRQGLKVSCPEEIVWKNGYINDTQLAKLAEPLQKSGYGKYLLKLLEKHVSVS